MIVLVIPKRNESAIKWVVAGAARSLTFLVTLVALGNYLDRRRGHGKPLAERAANNTLIVTATDAETTSTRSTEAESGGQNDLVVRRPWIPYVQHPVLPGPRRDQPEPGAC